MELVITFHAQKRMDQQGISEELIRLALQRGAKIPQTDGFLATYTYLQVAYKVRGEKYIIKTVMITR